MRIAITSFIGAVMAWAIAGQTAMAQGVVHAQLVRQDIAGVALYPDGQTPVERLPVQVWDAARERVIYKTETDVNGTFRVPAMRSGPACLYVGRVKVDLDITVKNVESSAQPHTIVVVLNRYMVFTPLPAAAALTTLPFLEEPTTVSP